MAIFDALFEFSDGQSVTSSVVADKIIDFGTLADGSTALKDLEMGAGEPLWLNIRVGEGFLAAGSVQFGLYYHTAEAVGSGTAIWETPTIAYGVLVAGYWVIRMPLPYKIDQARYVGLYYTVATTKTKGTINAWLDHGPQSSHHTQVSASNI